MALILAVLLCLGSGFLVVCLGWPGRRPIVTDFLFRACLSIGFGLGIFSSVFFFSRLFHIANLIRIDLAVFALLLVSHLWLRARVTIADAGTVAEDNSDEPAWVHTFLTAGFAIALCAALYSAIMRTLAHPHGDGWDAFSIWNLHARFLFRGGDYWRDGFTALLPWSHPDYPLLLPGAVAHFWSYLGRDTPAVPAIIGFLFTFSTAGLLFSVLSMLRGRGAALLGTTALLATPSFFEQGTAQYADVPLSFFVLASIALICLHDQQAQDDPSQGSSGLLALAGLATACAAWTKNEGLLFLCSIVLARLITLLRDGASPKSGMARARLIAPLVVVILPAFLLIACFKHFIAPPGDLFSDHASTLHKVLSPPRYWAIIQWYIKGFFRFGHWLLIPGTLLMIGFYYFFAGKREEPQTGIRTSVLALTLTLAGYFAVYLITPYDIYWHLRFSLTRLFLQLWPSAIFLLFRLVDLRVPRAQATST